MMKLYNSSFEISLRVLILLDVYQKPLSLDSIKEIDILSTYCKYYNIGNTNLHGDSSYTLSEIAARRELINDALKSLVLQGYIDLKVSPDGFLYSINSVGSEIHRKMTSDYATEYEKSVKLVKKKTSNLSSKEINNLLYCTIRRN